MSPLTLAPTSLDRGVRLDALLRARLPEFSRARLQQWIKAGRVRIDGIAQRASYTIRGSELIEVDPAQLTPLQAAPENIALSVLYEDEDLVAIDKPAAMAVHAGAGIRSGTLVNALLHRFESLSNIGGDLRPGIVHRLDRFTSGVVLVAKSDQAHRNLAAQFAARRVQKTYLALVTGNVKSGHLRIEKPISRDPVRRERMTARIATGRAAWSEFRVLQRFEGCTYIEVRIGTGRTHQIRVHLSSIGHPVVGDRLYGAPPSQLNRYFLHAHRIQFDQPSSGVAVEVESPLAPELETWLAGLL